MPHDVVHRLRTAQPENRRGVIEAVNRAMIEALRVPDWSSPTELVHPCLTSAPLGHIEGFS